MKQRYTQEQYDYARYQTSALEYAKAKGYTLKKQGSYHISVEHDSMVFAPNGMFFWNSHDIKGGAIEFLTQVEHKNLVEAVLELSSGQIRNNDNTINNIPSNNYSKTNTTMEKAEFILPKKSTNSSRLFAYLCKTRGLDNEIVSELYKTGDIYLGEKPYNDKILNNIIFVGRDEKGEIKSAYQRSCNTYGKDFKGDVRGSEKDYPFTMKGDEESTKVSIYESSIDAMSKASIEKQLGNDYKDTHRIAIGGLFINPIVYFLEKNPNVKDIIFSLDNDDAGRNNISKLLLELVEKGFTEENGYTFLKDVSKAKDWNEELINFNEKSLQSVKPMITKSENTESQETSKHCEDEELER